MNPTNINTFTKQLTQELVRQATVIEQTSQSPFLKHQQLSDLFLSGINQVKDMLKSYSFLNEEEEIYFFKRTFPLLLSFPIYMSESFHCIHGSLTGLSDVAGSLGDQLIEKIKLFMSDNEDFLLHCQLELTCCDNDLYLQTSNQDKRATGINLSENEDFFCPAATLTKAKWLAYQSLYKMIRDGNDCNDQSLAYDPKQAVWTESKIALTEVIYSFKETGAINYGRATLKQITACFEKMFSIDLGNVSKSFQDIKNRKTGRPLFMDRLKANLEKAIEREIQTDIHTRQGRDSLENRDFSVS